MTVKLSQQAADFAEELIGNGDYRISTIWREARPSDEKRNDMLERNGFDALARWYLGRDDSAEPGTIESLVYPLGDYKSIHRNAIVAARDDAQKQGYTDIAAAADELIFFFDRISAC